MRPKSPYMRSIQVCVNRRYRCTLESTRSLRVQWCKIQLEPCLANVHSAVKKKPRSGAYKKHLRTARAILGIVLTSTIQYINIESNVLQKPKASRRQDSDCESNPGPAGSERAELCGDSAYESDTDVFDYATSSSLRK